MLSFALTRVLVNHISSVLDWLELNESYVCAGEVDPNAVYSIANARAAGINYVDVYMFPCPQCGDAAEQVRDMGKMYIYSYIG